MSSHTFTEAGARRIVSAVRQVESMAPPALLPPGMLPRNSGAVLVKITAEIAHPKWEAEEMTLTTAGALVAVDYGQRVWDEDVPLIVLGPPPIVGQILEAFPYPGFHVALGMLSRISRRVTGNTDFGATLWEGSTVGTDEMWEEYLELNTTTHLYEKKARKLFGACP